MANKLQDQIHQIFEGSPEMIFGFTGISSGFFAEEYQSALYETNYVRKEKR